MMPVITLLLDLPVEFLLVANGVQPRTGHHHRLGSPADLVASESVEVLQHDFRLLGDVVRMQAHEPGQRFGRLALADLRIFLGGLHQPIIRLVGRVILENSRGDRIRTCDFQLPKLAL